MNIKEFELAFFKLFNKNTRLRKLAAEIELVVSESSGFGDKANKTITIDAMNGRKRVGFIEFMTFPTHEVMYFTIIDIQNEYRNTNLAMRLFKEFYKIYKKDYWGYVIKADIVNPDLASKFKSVVDKYFPPNVDQTDAYNEDFENWDALTEEKYFGINRHIDIDSLPEPFRRMVDKSPSNLLGHDVLYKDISQNDVQNLIKAKEIIGEMTVLSIIFSNDSVYYLFTSNPWANKHNYIDVNPIIMCIVNGSQLTFYLNSGNDIDIINKSEEIKKATSIFNINLVYYINDDKDFKNIDELVEYVNK